jgi:hypothetical protein
MTEQHIPVLKRVGWVLLAIGVIDIAYMVYCIVNRISYSSSFNIFAVIAGAFLLRCSLRAATIVRWFAAFMLSAMVCMSLAFPVIQPWGLTVTQMRLDPMGMAQLMVITVLVVALLFWLVRELGREPVRAAFVRAGRKWRDIRIPVALGAALAVSLGETADRAKAMAQQQVGQGYRLHVTSLRVMSSSHGKSVSAVVTAWKADQILHVPVSWRE